MKKFFGSLVCLILVIVLMVGCSSNQAGKEESPPDQEIQEDSKVIMKFAGTTTADPNLGEYQAMLKFEQLVEEYSEGSIDVEVYPAEQLGGSVEFTEGTALGTVEACVVGFDGLGNIVPECYALCMPYLYDNIEQMRPILENETNARAAIDKVLSDSNFKLVGILYRPMRVTTNIKRPINSPKDMKGLQVRSPSSEANVSIINAMGGIPTTISWSEVFTALQQNACDGVENAITELASINLQEIAKYVSETNHMPSPIALVVNESWFKELSDNQKEAVMKAGVEVTEWRAQNVAEETKTAWDKFESAGVEVLYADEIDFTSFKDACADVYKEFVDKGYFTEDFFNSLKN